MFHLTHTGVYAGRPICGADKAAAFDRGETFEHPAINGKVLQQQLNSPDCCPACRAEWLSLDEQDADEE